MWWLNGEEVVILSGDRRMVKDDCLSKRLTLKKGKNIIRGAVINGPGMSDFVSASLTKRGLLLKTLLSVINNHENKNYILECCNPVILADI